MSVMLLIFNRDCGSHAIQHNDSDLKLIEVCDKLLILGIVVIDRQKCVSILKRALHAMRRWYIRF
jgi:hypothetical protein